MSSSKIERDNYADIVKAIGIISIVIGHSSWTITRFNIEIGPFVYAYHLMIFMFISGYLFSTKKAENDPNYKYYSLGKQLINFIKLYFIYTLLFVVLHNSLVSIYAIDSTNYSILDIFSRIINSLSFSSSEILMSAFWFIPTLIIARILFTITYSDKNVSKWYKIIPIIVVFSLIGLILCKKNIRLNYRIQISILSVPIIYFGVLVKKYWNKIQKFITPWAWIICSIIISIVNHISKTSVELSVNRLISPFIFYPLTLVGIYFCLSLAKMISKIKHINCGVATVGKYSFHIMALHFLVIKLVDVVYSKTHGISNVELITHFPNSYSNKLYLIYYLLGVLIPTLVMVLIDKIKNKIIKK